MNTKKILFLAISGAFLMSLVSDAAAPVRRGGAPAASGASAGAAGGSVRGGGQRGGAPAAGGASAGAAAAPVASARSATMRGGAPTATAAPAGGAPVSARSAVMRGGGAPTGGAAPAAGGTTLSARSGNLNSVVQKAPTVNAATSASGLVNEDCKQKWFGCMDTFCILGNENGMRCSCSNDRPKYDSILKQIEELNDKIILHGQAAVDKLTLSDAERKELDIAMKKAGADLGGVDLDPSANNAAPRGNQRGRTTTKNAFGSLSLDASFDMDADQPRNNMPQGEDFSALKGKALFDKAANMCRQQLGGAGCNNQDMIMIQTMYNQQVASDCGAYSAELATKQKKAQENLRVVEAGIRETALEQIQNANKYDLGECVSEFRKCMQTNDTCGSDWGRCATTIADAAALAGYTAKPSLKSAWGSNGVVALSEMTMYNVNNREPLCGRVLEQCQRANDPDKKGENRVFMRFVQLVAPELRSAELVSEGNQRQNCLLDVTECIQRTCDLQSTDPMVRNTCLGDRNIAYNNCAEGANGKLGLNKCESFFGKGIWEALDARLKSMRVGECETAVKDAVQKNCGGETYMGCLGMSINDVLGMIMSKSEDSTSNGNASTGTATQNQDGSFNNLDAARDRNPLLYACRDVKTSVTGAGANAGESLTDADYANSTATIEKVRPIVQGLLMNIRDGQVEACISQAAQIFEDYCKSPVIKEDADDKSATEIKTDIDPNKMDCADKFREKSPNLGLNWIKEQDNKLCGFDSRPLEFDIGQKGHIEFSNDWKANNDDWQTHGFGNELINETNKIIDAMINSDTTQKLRLCIEGKDLSQVTGSTTKSQGAGMPEIMRQYALRIAAAGENIMNDNFDKKKAEFLKSRASFFASIKLPAEQQCMIWGYGNKKFNASKDNSSVAANWGKIGYTKNKQSASDDGNCLTLPSSSLDQVYINGGGFNNETGKPWKEFYSGAWVESQLFANRPNKKIEVKFNADNKICTKTTKLCPWNQVKDGIFNKIYQKLCEQDKNWITTSTQNQGF